MATKVQAENEKIAQAMKGQAAARRRSAKERATGPRSPEEIIASAKADGILVDHDAGLQEGERPLSGTIETPKEETVQTTEVQVEKTPKQPRVLEDPVENAKLIRMRAKWSAERVERRLAREEEALEVASTPADRREVSGRMKTLRSELAQAKRQEREAYKAYRVLLEERQKARKVSAKTASPVAETA